jgi:hypothetical protein
MSEEKPQDPVEYAATVRHEHQRLRHQAHHKLMAAFLEPETFDGHVTIQRTPSGPAKTRQLRLVDNTDS